MPCDSSLFSQRYQIIRVQDIPRCYATTESSKAPSKNCSFLLTLSHDAWQQSVSPVHQSGRKATLQERRLIINRGRKTGLLPDFDIYPIKRRPPPISSISLTTTRHPAIHEPRKANKTFFEPMRAIRQTTICRLTQSYGDQEIQKRISSRIFSPWAEATYDQLPSI